MTNCVQNVQSECNKINSSIKDYKSHTDTSMNSVSSTVIQKREEVENKLGNITHELRSVASCLDQCNCSIQMDNRNYLLEIQSLESLTEILRPKYYGNLEMHSKSAVCVSPGQPGCFRIEQS